jgi:prepilin-type N-terminal cleavage/methylation domain-containing protein
MRRAIHHHHHDQRGFTAVEVMMAMTVMTIGVAAVMTMHKTSVTANLDARKTDVANAIGRTWVERLRRDTMSWTAPGSENPTGNNFANAALIAPHVTGVWFLPTDEMSKTNPETMSPGFDILGRDLAAADLPTAQFCVNVRLTWLVAPALPSEPGLIRADVRVLWPRGISATPTGFCNDGAAAADNPDPNVPPLYHAIYMTTTLKENGQ